MPVSKRECGKGNAVMGLSSHACSMAVQQLLFLTCKRGLMLLSNMWQTGSVAHCGLHP